MAPPVEDVYWIKIVNKTSFEQAAPYIVTCMLHKNCQSFFVETLGRKLGRFPSIGQKSSCLSGKPF